MDQFGLYLLMAVLFIVIIEFIAYIIRHKKYSAAQGFLIQAKQEAQEIAQLPLHNPHPQLQISESGKLIFANPAALKSFPNIVDQGFQHPALNGINTLTDQEIVINDKTYHQTIAQTIVNGERAFAVYFHDITDRKWFEKEIKGAHARAEKMRAEAEKAKEARGEFLANMSHELRTPMNGIIGLSDMLVDMQLEGEKQEFIEAVNNSAKNLLILLNDILDFSKIEAGELSIEKIPFNIRKTVKQIESLQKPIASQKGINMGSTIADNVPHTLIGDPSRLQQILNNLMSNALKFTDKGSVSISIYGEEKVDGIFTTHITVKDTGIGIPKDKQASVFQKFQQADSSTARKYGGTGLGLTITQNLTKLMNGTIEIESDVSIGTTFIVTLNLPVDNDFKAEESDLIQPPKVHLNKNARIMIVDDHPINLLFLKQLLTKFGYAHIDEANNGKAALDHFARNRYDLIIMDCQMPDMDGFEAAQRIREMEEAESAPIIIAATADAMKGAEERCIASGMDDYISKPIDASKLRHILNEWIPANEKEAQQKINDEEDHFISKKHTAPKEQNDIIDWNYLHEFTDGNTETEALTIDIFITNLRSDIENLHVCLKNKDYSGWDSWVHKLYGASAHIGAVSLAKKCDYGQSLPLDDYNEIHKTHKAILIEYKRVNDFFESYSKD